MKSENEIRDEIVKLNHERAEIKKRYNQLNQIDILAKEGDELRSFLNFLLGQIAALTWVLNK